MISENVSHHLSHQMCNGGKVCLVGEHPDNAPSQFAICVMKYETQENFSSAQRISIYINIFQVESMF